MNRRKFLAFLSGTIAVIPLVGTGLVSALDRVTPGVLIIDSRNMCIPSGHWQKVIIRGNCCIEFAPNVSIDHLILGKSANVHLKGGMATCHRLDDGE
jgi:hypothetical protein